MTHSFLEPDEVQQIQDQGVIEKYGSHEQIMNDRGATARRTLIIRHDLMGSTSPNLPPRVGDAHPNAYWQGLIVDQVTARGIGVPLYNPSNGAFDYQYWECDIEYSTDRTGLRERPRISIEWSVEALNTCAGRVWLNADGTPTSGGTNDKIDVEDLPQTILYPLGEISLERTEDSLYPNILSTYLGTVNTSAINIPVGQNNLACAPETLLFEGPSTQAIYDASVGEYVQYVVYKLLYRPVGHNMIWKPAKRVWDTDKGDWKRDDNGNYVYEGQSKWMRSDPANYPKSDFSWLFATEQG